MVDKPEWFSGRLRELRESLNWTREVLSERSGIPAPTIRDIESGRRLPGWANVLALAAALGVDLAEFAKEPAPRDPPKKGRPKQVPQEPPAKGEKPAKSPSDRTDRLVLSDALAESGRDIEADICREEAFPIKAGGGRVKVDARTLGESLVASGRNARDARAAVRVARVLNRVMVSAKAIDAALGSSDAEDGEANPAEGNP